MKLNTLSVLVLEKKDQNDTLKQHLEKIVLRLKFVSSHQEALLYAQNSFIDLAFVHLCKEKHLSFIKTAKDLWHQQHIPIIFLSSYSNDQMLIQAMESEPYAYLLKPCSTAELKTTLYTAIHKHRFFYEHCHTCTPKHKYKGIFLIQQDISYHTENSELFFKDQKIKLTKNEKKLLEILSTNAGNTVSFEMIASYIWRDDTYNPSKLRSLIYRLKNKLGSNPVENIYEEGYRLKIVEQTTFKDNDNS